MKKFRRRTDQHIETPSSKFINALVGVLIAFIGGYFLNIEMREIPTHTVHVVIFTAILVVGILVAFGPRIFPVIRQTVVIFGPYIPRIGGRRASDPPADE